MDQVTRKLITIYKTLNSRDILDRLYVSRKGGRGLASINDCVYASIQKLEEFIKKSKSRLITSINNSMRKISRDRRNNKN